MRGRNRDRNRRSSILEIKFKFEIGLQLKDTDLSRDWPLISGVTEACLKRVGKLPSAKERFARCAIISS